MEHHFPKYKSFFITCTILLLASAMAALFFLMDSSTSANIELIYVLALVLIARFTDSYLYGVFASIVGVISVNFLYTYPFMEINFTLSGYPVTFIGMLSISMVTSAAASNIKEQSKLLAKKEKMLSEAEKEKMRSNLLRAVSHDLRTPLTSIIGASASYLENNDSLTEEERIALVTNIREDSEWLLNMVENLLSVTRINNQEASVTTSLEVVEEVISEAVQRFKKRIPNAHIQVQAPDVFLMIPMDAVLIEQVIINLLENAVFHSHSESTIDLTVEDTEQDVLFRIRDYGVGLDPDKLDSIFDGTDMLSEQLDGHKGMGIGLSICKTIIVAHKGFIQAIHHDDGAEFLFSLPKQGA